MGAKGVVFGFLLVAGGVGGLAVHNGWLGSPEPASAAPTTQPAGARTSPSAKTRPAVVREPEPLPEVFTKLTAEERAAVKLVQQVKTLRAAVDVWKKRHDGRSPDFERNPMWQQFLVREGKFPPYFKSAPVNAANNFFRVLSMKGPVNGGEDVRVAGIGWVYCLRTGKLWATDGRGKVFDDEAVDGAALEARLVFDLPPREQEARLLVLLAETRAQVKKYHKDHQGRAPDFNKHPAFEQFLKVTTPDGLIVPFPPGPTVCGPYLATVPINPLNGLYKAVSIPGPVRPGQSAPQGAGYVYSPSLQNLFATDRNGRVLDDATVARNLADSAEETLETLRDQVKKYRKDHGDKVPDLKRYPNWQQLTGATRPDGALDAKGSLGPYLPRPPVNPRNAYSAVEVIPEMPKTGGHKPKKGVGWVYESPTGRVWLTDETGNLVPN